MTYFPAEAGRGQGAIRLWPAGQQLKSAKSTCLQQGVTAELVSMSWSPLLPTPSPQKKSAGGKWIFEPSPQSSQIRKKPSSSLNIVCFTFTIAGEFAANFLFNRQFFLLLLHCTVLEYCDRTVKSQGKVANRFSSRHSSAILAWCTAEVPG